MATDDDALHIEEKHDCSDEEEDAEVVFLLNPINSSASSERRYLRRKQKSVKTNTIFSNMAVRSLSNICVSIYNFVCCRRKDFVARTIWIGQENITADYPNNVIRNQKYSILTFLPIVLYNQFKFFLNLFFLVMAISQFIPQLRIGYIYTYWGPLSFVIFIALVREAIDDYRRFCQDREVNLSVYHKLTNSGIIASISSSKIKVGDLIYVEKGCRVPADMVLLRTTEPTGTCFIQTDQLDGETDWKKRVAIHLTQALTSDEALLNIKSYVYAEQPQKDIHCFFGRFGLQSTTGDGDDRMEALSIENTLWANTVVASGTALGIVIYSCPECRATMNTSPPSSKVGLLDEEVNALTKLLFAFTILLALILIILKGFDGPWYVYMFRFILLFSYLIPISLRVNLDVSKIFYSWQIQQDPEISGTVARSTTIPEELGRVSYLLSDKTGTLTQNKMMFKKLHIGDQYFSSDTFNEVGLQLRNYYSRSGGQKSFVGLVEAVKAIVLCHNVTPVYESKTDAEYEGCSDGRVTVPMTPSPTLTYQAASPDEMALVLWADMVGLSLIERDMNSMLIRAPNNVIMRFKILLIFPFTSQSKRMGIIVRDEDTGVIVFYVKGADIVMCNIVQYNDWLMEEVNNLAREGLRTLVVAMKVLTNEQFADFEKRYKTAKLSDIDRSSRVARVVESLEREMNLLCVTGVEDILQEGTRNTLEQLRHAGIKVWMLTGDKLETAVCIAKSTKLVTKTQPVYVFDHVTTRTEAHQALNVFRRKQEPALVIIGDSLEVCLKYYDHEFMELAANCPIVVCCRCSPEQKAQVVRLVQQYSGKRAAAIGDGGNDVSMIQAAAVGIGIFGKEGMQAALAADFSITQFSHVSRLLLVHGRNSYKRSATLSQFIFHRGLIVTTMQAIFSSVFYFASVSLYQGVLMVGYGTFYTMLPVLSLVLDLDVQPQKAMMYPELYKDLVKGRSLTYKTFCLWMLISLYQGGVIMFGALFLFEDEFVHIVAISFTALILTELIMVALTIRTWHWIMVLAEFASFVIYCLSLVILKSFFDSKFVFSFGFLWKTLAITAVSCVPLAAIKLLRKRFSPPSYQKLS